MLSDCRYQMEVVPPVGLGVVTHGSPAHPAAVLPGLISQAPAGSTLAADTYVINFCVRDVRYISHKVILEQVFATQVVQGIFTPTADYLLLTSTSEQWSSGSETCSLCILDLLVALLLLPTELFREWRTLRR